MEGSLSRQSALLSLSCLAFDSSSLYSLFVLRFFLLSLSFSFALAFVPFLLTSSLVTFIPCAFIAVRPPILLLSFSPHLSDRHDQQTPRTVNTTSQTPNPPHSRKPPF